MVAVLEIALYSNDPLFLRELPQELSARLGDAFRINRYFLFQTSLFDQVEAPPDLCLVDLRDDPAQALDFVGAMRRGAGTEVMAVAAGPEWAMEAYDRDILAYYLDPPDPARVAERVLRVASRKTQAQAPEVQFPFRTAAGLQLVPAERVVYVEYSAHRMLVHTDMGRQLSTTTMRASFGEAAAPLLRDPRFVRTHASFLANITHVARFQQFTLTMDTGAAVPVSHARRAEVLRQFNQFFGG